MPPRPVLRLSLKVEQNRPISAIYIGKDTNSRALQPTPSSLSPTQEATSPPLPDLPKLPSPRSRIRSVQSGLPSPPATNSTGSGSTTGDPPIINFQERSILSHHSNSMNSGTASTPMKHSLNGSEAEYDDYDKENGNDYDNDSDDDTATLNAKVIALQRAKSLAERNRMASYYFYAHTIMLSYLLDLSLKGLRKVSRMSAASPHPPSPPRSDSETGSETEYESSPSSPSHHRPSPSLSPVSLHDPSHQPLASTSLSSSNSSHSRRGKKDSMVSMPSLQLTDFEEEEVNGGLKKAIGTAMTRTHDRTLTEQDLITQSALAAVASSRRSPLSSRPRATLPKEFRSNLVDDSPSPASPSTGRISVAGTQKESVKPDIKELVTYLIIQRPVDPVTPLRSTRPSTVRNYRGSDLPSTVRDRQYNTTHSNKDGNPKEERRQTLRGGSAESALLSPGGRRLIREGLNAAGLGKKMQEDGRVDWSPEDNRSMLPERLHSPRAAATSIADYRNMDNEDDPDRRYRDTDRPASRLRSRDRESSLARAGSSFSRYNHNNYVHTPSSVTLLSTPQRTLKRLSTPSPFGIRRLNTQTPVGGSSSNQTEHIKLMLENLTMLETQLNKIPVGKSVGGSTTGTDVRVGTGPSQTELAKNTQSMVYAAERLSDLLKKGSGRAVEEQVEAEVEGSSTGPDTQEISNIWGRVAAEYRENSRVADELVRGMTGFLLEIGRVMKDVGPSSLADYAGGSPSVHGKHASFDADEEELGLRRGGASLDEGSAGSGSRSGSLRNSWEPRERDRMVTSSGSGSAGAGEQRPESALATYQKLRSGASIEKSLPALPDRSRRLFTPREQRERMLDAKFSSRCPVDGSGTSMEQPQSHESSPTPASRTRGGNTQERETMLSPLKIPTPLPTLPSETLVRRRTINNHVERTPAPTSATPIGRDHRSTIRSSLQVPSTTTLSSSHSKNSAHTTRSGSASAFPLQRSKSSRSDHSHVTFSR